ncbi:MAG: hypothetical protein GY950_37685 [bacterium]|nr:hypothetical protein [bacterium]
MAILILSTVYAVIDKEADTPLTAEEAVEEFRDIETPGKKWLNGYLGVFFRFKYLGNINWLALPLLVYFFVTVRRRPRWQMGLVFVWCVTVLFLVFKGYTNFRYQFTLFPFTAVLVLLLLWEFLKEKKNVVKILCFSLLGIVCLYNIYHYFERYEFYWDIRVSREKAHFPRQLIDYLNNAPDLVDGSRRVLVFDQPLFYYYTGVRGLDERSPSIPGISKRLKRKTGNRGRLFNRIKKGAAVDYILLGSTQKKFYRSLLLTEFLDCECRPVLNDHGRFLYRLRNKPLEQELRSPRFKRFKLWQHRKKRPRNVSPWMKTFWRKGTFNFDYKRVKKKNRLLLRNREPGLKGIRQINLGFELGSKGLDMKIPGRRYIHFIVRASVSPALLNRKNFLFVSDYNGDEKNWKSEQIRFSSPYRRTYIVSHKVRKGSKRVIMGFRFTPTSPGDTLTIENARVYVSDENL